MSCEAHGDEDQQHAPAVEPSDDSAYDALDHEPCYLCEGTGTWNTCDATCRDCNGKGYVLTDTRSGELFA